MGREIRRVPLDWEHPRYTQENSYRPEQIGQYMPVYDKQYDEASEEWISNLLLWQEKKHPSQFERYKYVWEYLGNPPDESYYRQRKWTEEEATAYQIYQTVSEGTPVSPVFATTQDMYDWLIAEGYSPYAAKSFIEDGSCMSMVAVGGKIASNLKAYDLRKEEKCKNY